jgi:hypothetical protein
MMHPILRILLICIVLAFRSTVTPSLYADWPILEEREQFDTRAAEAAKLAVTKTALIQGTDRLSLGLNGKWYQCIQGESNWEEVQVPEMWRGSGASHVRWFARRFVMPPGYAGKHIRIKFNAIMLYAEVWMNGQHLGSHAGGYTPFSVDATSVAKPGDENTILVYVKDNTYALDGEKIYHQIAVAPFIRAMGESGDKLGNGGIWQDVLLEGLNPIYVDDVFVRSSVREQRLDFTVAVRNAGTEKQRIIVYPEIREWPEGSKAIRRPFEQSMDIAPGESKIMEFTESWPDPKLWSPEHPNLYNLITNLYYADPLADAAMGSVKDVKTTRFGFREFWIDGRHFFLNGQKIRLRGNSISSFLNRYDFTKRAFEIAKEEFGLNSFRSHASIGPELIFEAADEVGILMIDQSSIWSSAKRGYTLGSERLLENTRLEFEEWIKRDRNHPSVVIWDVENEMIRGAWGASMQEAFAWVLKLDDLVAKHDTTRPIEHSGAGSSHPSLPIYHIHHRPNYTNLYEAYMRNPDKPMIAGEWWVGGQSGERQLTTGEEFWSYRDYLRRMGPLWKERMDEQRVVGLAGIQPFSWMRGGMLHTFENLGEPPLTWVSPTAPGIKPQQAPWYMHLRDWDLTGPEYKLIPETAPFFKMGLSALHLAFADNHGYFFADEPLRNTIVASNDSESPQTLTVEWQLLDNGRMITQGNATSSLKPAEQFSLPIDFPLPDVDEVPALLELTARLLTDGQVRSEDNMTITVYPTSVHGLPELGGMVTLFDPAGSIAPKLKQSGIRVITDNLDLSTLNGALVIGEGVSDAFWQQQAEALWQWVAQGNRLLIMRQDAVPPALPVAMDMYRLPPNYTYSAFRGFDFGDREKIMFYSRRAMIHMPTHPLMQGIPGDRIQWWRYDDGRVADDILIRPTMKNAPITTNIRSILGGARREYSSLIEFRHGHGMILLTQLHISPNYDLDPTATRLFHNLLEYLSAQSTGLLSARAAVVGELPGDWHITDDGNSGNADVLIVGEMQSSDNLNRMIETMMHRGATVLLTPDAPLPAMIADKVRLEPLEATPVFAPVKQYSHAIAGFNSFDFADWEEPCVRQNIVVTADMTIEGHLLVGSAPVSTRGGMQGISHTKYLPMGNALVELPMGKGKIIVSQIPWPTNGNNRAKYVYSAILTNLGVRIGGE